MVDQRNGGIAWTDFTWNPIRAHRQNAGTGEIKIGWHCEKVSAACTNCYAESMNKRLGSGPYDLLLRGLVAACGTRNIQAANAARELPGPFDDEPLQAAITRVMADAPPSIIPEL